MNDHGTSRIRRILKWAWTGTRWMLFMASGCLAVLVAYLWIASFNGPPQSALAVFGTRSYRRPLDEDRFHLRVLDRDSDWAILAAPDPAWDSWDRNVYLYAESESGRFIIGQMMARGDPWVDQESRRWLHAIGRMPDYSGNDPQSKKFLTSFLWGTVVFCNFPETAATHFAVKALRVSYWFAMLIAVIPLYPLAVATLRRYRRFRRRSINACTGCGYNLKGNESGVCPECATPVPKRGATA